MHRRNRRSQKDLLAPIFPAPETKNGVIDEDQWSAEDPLWVRVERWDDPGDGDTITVYFADASPPPPPPPPPIPFNHQIPKGHSGDPYFDIPCDRTQIPDGPYNVYFTVTKPSENTGPPSPSTPVIVVNSPIPEERVAGYIDLSVPDDNASLGVGSDRVLAKVYEDKYKQHPMEDVWVVFYVSPTDGVQATPWAGKSDGRGQVPMALTSLTENQVTVTASGGHVSSLPTTAYFKPALITVDHVVLSLPDGDSATADGTASIEADAAVYGTDQNLMPGITVSFIPDPVTGVTAPPATTGKDPNDQTTYGIAKTQITSTAIGNPTLIASIGDIKSNPKTLHFTPVQIGVDHIKLTLLNGDTAASNGRDYIEAAAAVYDTSSKLMPGVLVSFTPTHGATAPPATTGSDPKDPKTYGIATTKVTCNTAGDSSLTASCGGKTSNRQILHFEAVDNIYLSLPNVDTTVANGKDKIEVQASVNGPFLRVPNMTVCFEATNGAKADPPTAITGNNGIATSYISSTDAVDSVVTASLRDGSKQSNAQTVHFKPSGSYQIQFTGYAPPILFPGMKAVVFGQLLLDGKPAPNTPMQKDSGNPSTNESLALDSENPWNKKTDLWGNFAINVIFIQEGDSNNGIPDPQITVYYDDDTYSSYSL